MKTKYKRYLILIIISLAAFLRIWKLNSIPPHLTSDEAALGYNAYSILKTGRDEYGQLLPIIFKSFGDYKPGLYIYSAVPFVALFGLNEMAVRLPSALAGVIAVWLIYKIVSEFKRLEKNNEIISHTAKYLTLEHVGAGMLALSPWHIHFSRGAWEVNLSLTLTLAGILFFLKALDKPKFIILSSVFFSLTLLTYQGAKISTAIILIILLSIFLKNIKSWFESARGPLLGAVVIGFLISLPIIFSLFQGKTGRLNVFSVFSYPRKQVDIEHILDQGHEKQGGLAYYLFHSETLNLARGVMGRWYNHYSGRFLFFEGDWQNPRHSAPNHGEMLLIDIILVICGFIFLARNKTKLSAFIILWLLLSPLPGALSRDQVHAVRSLNMVIPLTLLTGCGVIYLVRKFQTLKNITIKTVLYSILVMGFVLSYIYFTDAYFVHTPEHNSKYWEYGYKQIVETLIPIKDNFKQIKVQQSFAQPYIFFLFYQKYDPAEYQKQAHLVESEYKGDVGYIENLGNICFCAIDWPVNKSEHGTLVVADSIRIPVAEVTNTDSVNLIKEIKFLNGETAFRVVEIK